MLVVTCCNSKIVVTWSLLMYNICICIYNIRGGIQLHPFLVTPDYTLCLQSPNSRSKPFNLLDMLKCVCRSNFTFFWIFFGFILLGTKIQWSEYSDFVKYLINSKKIQKNVKFDLQVTINIFIILNGLDRLFGLSNFENGHCHAMSPKKGCNRIPPLYIKMIHDTMKFCILLNFHNTN